MFVINYLKRLYDLRTDNDLRQEDIAKILGTTKQTYGRYENGTRKLQIEDLIKLANFYKVSTDYILGLTKDPTPNWTNKKVLTPMKSNNIENILNNNTGNIGDISINQS